LNFVAGEGAGDVSNIVIVSNVLHVHGMGIDLMGPAGKTRYGVTVAGNVSDTQVASTRESVMRFINYENVSVRDNVQPTPTNRTMSMVTAITSCNVEVTGNDLSPGGVGQVVTQHPRSACSPLPPAPVNPPNYFEGQQMTIDVGNTSGASARCSDTAHCDGYLTTAAADTHVVTAPVIDPVASQADRSMLMGNFDFSIPMRNGNYKVTMTFVEPVLRKGSVRLIFVDAENVRVLNAVDPFNLAHGRDKVVRRSFSLSVGDGALDMHVKSGDIGAVLSYVTITRD
jgi:hypothetical protein